jgi:predicted dehydrogenase
MAKTTLALIGCAHIHTPGFVKRLQARGDVEVKYVWDHDGQRAARWAKELRATRIADVAAALEDDTVAAALVCSETVRHEELVIPFAGARKHLFVEKPLGLGADDALRMAQAIDDAGVLFQTGYFQRGMPAHQFVKRQIEAGSFGKITRLRHSNCHSGSLGDWFTPEWLWMTDMAQAGVGAFGDLGTHSLDIMMWLLGEVTRVTASIHVATGRYGACDEFGEGLLDFANGAVGSLAAGWVDVAHPVNLILSGTEGHVYVAGGEVYFKSEHVDGATGETPWADLPTAWPHAFELFLDALLGQDDAPLVGVWEAAQRSIVMEALYQSADGQAWVTPKHSVERGVYGT